MLISPIGPTELQRCARALAALDGDHALEQNGVGFSQSDTTFGHVLATTPVEAWSDDLVVAAHRVLFKYRRQLDDLGLDMAAYPEPANHTPINKTVRVVDAVDGEFKIVFTYSPELVSAIKAGLPKRRWDGASKAWMAPSWCKPELMVIAVKYDFSLTPAAMRLEPSDLPHSNGEAVVTGPRVTIAFDYNPIAVLEVKEIVGRRWDGDSKTWNAPVTSIRQILAFAVKFGLEHASLLDVPDADPVMEPTVALVRGKFEIRFPYDRDLQQQVKDLPTAAFSRSRQAWCVDQSASIDVAEFIRASNGQTDVTAQVLIEAAYRDMGRVDASRSDDAVFVCPSLNGVLMPFQRAGVVYALTALGYVLDPVDGWIKGHDKSLTVVK